MLRGILAASLLLLVTTGCWRRLQVQTQYWDERQLASWTIRSPDPKLYCPDIGQKLFIRWSVPQSWLGSPDVGLQICLRYRNRQEDFFSIPIAYRRGTYTITVMNEEYAATQGILSYKISLIGNGTVQEIWEHPLWGFSD